jgi:hypothetical protein
MIMALLSLAIALLLVDLLLPQFNSITGKELDLRFSSNLMLSLAGIITITGLLAGSYPAFYLSRYNPAVVLKGSFNKQRGTFSELLARKGLIIFQFTLSVIFIVAVFVVYKQVEFVQTTYLGYEKDNIVYFKPEGKLATNLETFLAEARKVPGVINASSIARSIVGAQNSTVGYFHWEGKDPDAIIPFEIVNSNYELIETLGIKMKEGRSFQREFPQDTASIIFNEAGLEVMGLKDPIGKIFNLWGKDYRIIGITTNFHFESLHEKVKPLFFKLVPEEAERIMIRLAAGKEQSAIEALGELYTKDQSRLFLRLQVSRRRISDSIQRREARRHFIKIFCWPGDRYLLSRVIRPGCIYSGAQVKRNRNKKSARLQLIWYSIPVVLGFYQSCHCLNSHRATGKLFYHRTMACKFCFPHNTTMVVFCRCRPCGDFHCMAYGRNAGC